MEKLKRKILNYIELSGDDKVASYTLESWFQFARKFWEFTNVYSDLNNYSTVEERKEDILLFEFTKKLIG